MAQLIKRALALVFVQYCHMGSAGLRSGEADGRRVSETRTLQISLSLVSSLCSLLLWTLIRKPRKCQSAFISNVRLRFVSFGRGEWHRRKREAASGLKVPDSYPNLSNKWCLSCKWSFSVCLCRFTCLRLCITACSLHVRVVVKGLLFFSLYGGVVETARDVRLLWYDCLAGISTPGGKWPTPHW